tara:strand:- start:283 stop:756 length:474 start_codon:yes stop_codon:yes gene_type:complete
MQRKGIKKEKPKSFLKEYNYELTAVFLIFLGIFLLVENLEIKHYIYLFIQKILFSLRFVFSKIFSAFIIIIKRFETSDIVGIVLTLIGFYMLLKIWRDREILRYSYLQNCPDCGGNLRRIPRTSKQKFSGVIFGSKIKHYSCNICDFKGIKMSKKIK